MVCKTYQNIYIKDNPLIVPTVMVKFIVMIEITSPRPASSDPSTIAMNDNGQIFGHLTHHLPPKEIL